MQLLPLELNNFAFLKFISENSQQEGMGLAYLVVFVRNGEYTRNNANNWRFTPGDS